MKKRILILLIAATVLLGAFAVNTSAENATVVDSWSITLGDSIGTNFYFKLPEQTAKMAQVKVTVAEKTQLCQLSEETAGIYKICVNVAPAQMMQPIVLQLVVNGTEYAPVSYCVRDYAEHILNADYPEKVTALVRHMLDYGTAAQHYFGIDTDYPANEDYELEYKAQYPADYPELEINGKVDGLRLYGASLVMDSRVAVRYYFAADSVDGVTFRANGISYTPAKKDNLFYVEIPGILPQNYADPIILSAAKGSEKMEVTYSPLTYFVRMSEKGGQQMKKLVNAMYGYYEAAVAYLDSASATVSVPAVAGGTVTVDKTNCQWGETVTLTATPAAGYNLQSLVVERDGRPVDLGDISLAGGVYNFVAEDGKYVVNAEFAEPVFSVIKGDWDLRNQYNGSVSVVNKTADHVAIVSNGCSYNEVTVKVRDYTPSRNADGSLKKGDFSMQVYFIFDNGKEYQVRIHNTDDDGNYKLQHMGEANSLTGWENQAALTNAQKAELLSENGVRFTVKLVGANAELWVDDTLMKTVSLGEEYNGKLAQVKLCMNGNVGVQNMEIPYALIHAYDAAIVTIPAFENGTVTADKLSYRIGDTVKLTVTPDADYSQKLYINGEPLLLDWKTNTYSFVASKTDYKITGSFEKSLNTAPSDANRFDAANQAHGILNAYYPSNNDSWWMDIEGDYKAISVKAKNYWAVNDSYEGIANGGGFRIALRATMDNGKNYAFSVWIDNLKRYAYNHFGGGSSATGWSGAWCAIADKNADAIADFNADGAEFKLERIDGNHFQITLNGTILETYTIPDVTENNEVVSVGVVHYGNKGEKVAIPFELTKDPASVRVNIPTFENGAVTADKVRCKPGDTVTLTLAPSSGYYYQFLKINGESVTPDNSGKYSFVAQENNYTVSAGFVEGTYEAANYWNLVHQGAGKLVLESRSKNTDSWLNARLYGNDITTTVKDVSPATNDFCMIYRFTFDNAETLTLRLDGTDAAVEYRIQVMNGSTLSTQWKTHYTLNAAQISKVKGDGISFRVAIEGTNAVVYLDGTKVCAIDLSKVVDTGAPSYIEGIPVRVALRMDGNLNHTMTIPFALKNTIVGGEFKTSELSKYVIVYDDSISDYVQLANQLKNRISEKYGVSLRVVSDSASTRSQYEILLGDTNRYTDQGRVMEYSVTVSGGHFRINVGGPCSAERAITDLCDKAFNGQAFSLPNGDYYKYSLLNASRGITSGTTARVMSANVLADAFNTDTAYNKAYYRAEIFAGMLVSYTPDVIGMQEVDGNWSAVLDGYLTKIAKTHGVQYSRYLATYEGKTNYTSLLYRSDKFKVENSGVKVFTWWTNSIFNHGYHMRNVSWAQFSSLTDTSKKFIVANTHWSYNGEHVGKTLAGSSSALKNGDLKNQCRDETNAFLTSLRSTYSNCPIFVTGDFNTNIAYFTRWGWTAANYNVISQQAKSNGTALSTVPDSGHPDHIFGTGNYTVKCFEFFNSVNQHGALTDHSFVYADLAF